MNCSNCVRGLVNGQVCEECNGTTIIEEGGVVAEVKKAVKKVVKKKK